ncbi:O-acetylhomoserine aminocarboxypropyltransferase/cysteine synthase family protein [Bifidobacterium vespertilionis]|uniref:homocysteine desulfhydrase n=1 Tax=Bifidobacterium vespertilionis TaxID=2562524 RepID=A0A5J5DU41_9BIFI|nr:PLP-dependent transferase [Bifidobacterium vespertilionis]KAA8818821.1 O-acetylhomoserine aminocarboxypropyltransferase/cysteine synthase [Bifidobacterium vespertilionis]KAA8822955.1 O-acetylhomoserine aminocarboxypropyltransferase/cysteine synthase [Bifidobacterium vespertilionis]
MSFDFTTQSIHAGYDPLANGDAASVPIYSSAAFTMESAERGDALAAGEAKGFSYSRVANPTVDVLEKRIAALEGGDNAVAVASGMAAVSFSLLCAAEGGGRIISPTNLYGASVDAMETFFPQFGVHTDFVKDINDLAEVESKIGPDTRAIFCESVANPSTEITDIAALADLAHRHGVALIVDNTVPTPYLFRPIEFGADVVVHSTTKGITGHGNAIGGVVVDGGHFDWTNGRFPQFTRTELVVSDERNGVWRSFADMFGAEAYIRRVRIKYLRTFGAVASPFNAYLSLVGLETLGPRVGREVATATAVAKYLQTNPHVKAVNYSGIGTTGQDDLVAKYYPKGVGTILSFLMDGDESNVRRILDGAKLFSYVPNIGDARSLIVDPARITHREVPRAYREAAGVTDNLIRLSIGLEEPADLIADLEQAIGGAY